MNQSEFNWTFEPTKEMKKNNRFFFGMIGLGIFIAFVIIIVYALITSDSGIKNINILPYLMVFTVIILITFGMIMESTPSRRSVISYTFNKAGLSIQRKKSNEYFPLSSIKSWFLPEDISLKERDAYAVDSSGITESLEEYKERNREKIGITIFQDSHEFHRSLFIPSAQQQSLFSLFKELGIERAAPNKGVFSESKTTRHWFSYIVRNIIWIFILLFALIIYLITK